MSEATKERFLKHRRNTMLMALVALFLLVAGGDIKKISILGVLIEFTNSAMPMRLLMLSLVYMFVKYFQFLHEIGGTGILDYVNTKISNDAPKIAKSLFLRKEGKDEGYEEQDHVLIGRQGSWGYSVRRSTERKATSDSHKRIAQSLGDEITFGFTDVWMKYLAYSLIYALKTTWFGEYIVPIVLPLLALIFFFFGAPSLVEVKP